MATIRPDQLPPAPSVNPAAAIVVDDGVTVNKATPIQVVDSAIPLASQGEAEAGTDNAKRVTPLRVAQAIDALGASQAEVAARVPYTELASTAPGEGAALVVMESGRSAQDKISEIISVKDFSGATDLSRIIATVDAAKALSGTAHIDDNYTIDSEAIFTGDHVRISGLSGSVTQATPDQHVLAIVHDGAAHAKYGLIEGQTLYQQDATDPGSSLGNNWAAIKLLGANHTNVIGNITTNAAVAFGDKYGSSALADRSAEHNTFAFNHGLGIQQMGIEHICTKFAADVGNHIVGKDEGGGRALSHGRRNTGYSVADGTPETDPFEAPSRGNVGAGNVFEKMLSGQNVQNTARYWCTAGEHYSDCTYGFLGFLGTTLDNDPKLGASQFTAESCDYGIYHQGTNRTVFDFTASNIAVSGIEELPHVGAYGANMYRGVIDNATDRGADLRYDRHALDLTILSGSTNAIVSTGAWVSGHIRAFDNASQPTISGSRAHLKVTSSGNGANGLSASGSDGVYDIQTDGNLSVSGNNNVFSGRAATVSVTGTGNDFMNMKGMRSKGSFTGSTNASGDVVVTHSLLAICTQAFVQTTGGVLVMHGQTHSKGATTFAVRCTDAAGVALASTVVTFDWVAYA